MSYTFSFWMVSLGNLVVRLRSSGLVVPGGGEATPEQAGAVVELLGTEGTPLDSVGHSSSGGDWFREELVPGPVAGAIGAALAEHLLDRPIEGLLWAGFPSLGWAAHPELREAVSRLDALDDDFFTGMDDDDAESVHVFVDAVRRTAETGLDLVTVYS